MSDNSEVWRKDEGRYHFNIGLCRNSLLNVHLTQYCGNVFMILRTAVHGACTGFLFAKWGPGGKLVFHFSLAPCTYRYFVVETVHISICTNIIKNSGYIKSNNLVGIIEHIKTQICTWKTATSDIQFRGCRMYITVSRYQQHSTISTQTMWRTVKMVHIAFITVIPVFLLIKISLCQTRCKLRHENIRLYCPGILHFQSLNLRAYLSLF